MDTHTQKHTQGPTKRVTLKTHAHRGERFRRPLPLLTALVPNLSEYYTSIYISLDLTFCTRLSCHQHRFLLLGHIADPSDALTESGLFGVPLATLLDQDQRRLPGTKVPLILQRVSSPAWCCSV